MQKTSIISLICFRNKYFNKILLDNMQYFHRYAWFFDKYGKKNNVQGPVVQS